MNEHDLSDPTLADPVHTALDPSPADNTSGETSTDQPALYLGHDRVVRPFSEIVAPNFAFAREPNHLMILVQTFGAWVIADIENPARDEQPASRQVSDFIAAWPQDSAAFEKKALRVRAALDDFRERCSSYLNSVDADDLLAQLSEASTASAASWEYPGDPSPPHEQAWNDSAVQNALHNVAWHGYALFDGVFKEPQLREQLSALRPGDRLEVRWYSENGRKHQIPWGLMYLQPHDRSTPVDPMQFLGLRFRLEVFDHAQDSVTLCLGALRGQTPRAYCLYWDDSPEEISSEVRRQRDALDRWPGRIVLPTDGVSTPREELLEILNRRGPNPHVLYVFCRCRSLENAAVALRFSNRADDSPIGVLDLNQANLSNNPLVFINACDTAVGESGTPQDLEEYFFDRKCGAYIGTEAKVPVQLASRVAEGFFHSFYGVTGPQPLPAGEALAQIKLLLWKRYRNVGGIFYTLVNEHRLHISAENHDGADLPAPNGR